MKRLIISTGFLIAINMAITAQELYTLNANESTLLVEGTSSLHDWEMRAETMAASLKLTKDDNQIRDINDVSFSVDTKAIQSENSIMNNKTQDALKSDKYKQIRFELKSVSGINTSSSGISGFASGTLFIAGISKPVEFPFKMEKTGNNSLLVSGNEKIKMTDFGIDPPTAMLGTLKTGDEVTVKFELEFLSKESLTQNE